jgi:hypothetical protein
VSLINKHSSLFSKAGKNHKNQPPFLAIKKIALEEDGQPYFV